MSWPLLILEFLTNLTREIYYTSEYYTTESQNQLWKTCQVRREKFHV